jgi:glycosyltransferase involved in cell wall biosynthesis
MVKALLWAKHRRIPVIVATEIGAGLPQQKEVKLHTRLYHSLMAHLTDGQLACSPSARQPFGAPDRPIHFAPHSIDTTEFTVPESRFQTEPTRTQILTVAQYHPRKGLDLMAKALAPLKEKHSFQWRIIGILDPTWLKSVIQESDLQDHTVITGPIQGPDLIQEFQQAHLFVLPSRFDTYGVVTQEAAACGLPLLISQHAGSSHNLVTSQNGQVITPEDTAAFTAALDHQLTHKELWPAQSLASRQLAETWCVRQSATSTAQWLQAHFLKS